MNSLNLKSALAVVAVIVMVPVIGRAGEVKVENLSNDDIYVAVAFNKWKGDLAAHGWTKIERNKSHTFKAADGEDMYLRVEKKSKEVTWTLKDKSTSFWPVNDERFTVSKPSDEPGVQILKWGEKLENEHNIRKGGKLPAGWETKRFFRVGDQKLHLHVTPD